MKKSVFLAAFTLTLLVWSCGIPKNEHEKTLIENEQLKDEIAKLNEELNQYKYGEARTIALIEQAVSEKNVELARHHINIFVEYHPESTGNENYKKLVRFVDQEEKRITDALEAAEKERIKQERLANIGKTLDNPIIIDGRSGDLDKIVKDIIFNKAKYNGKYISIQNTYFEKFGVDQHGYNISRNGQRISIYRSNDTFELKTNFGSKIVSSSSIPTLYKTMSNNKFYFFFHPLASDDAARRLMINLNGEYLNETGKFNTLGYFFISDNSELVFTVSQFTYNGNTYNGELQ